MEGVNEVHVHMKEYWWVEGGKAMGWASWVASRGVLDKQSFTDLLYGGHECGETSTVVS